ncbi:MAG: undecaprenyl-diphosphatase UppP [Candidatus Harrisonbacteria bacterium CG10_big_fil_rev_8_21_14_0_10_40_38]|uniref:Undecaprenyl-diphosphatase n=1 Tax=Candidatus Harrisonbacteria bacterium CG10_big_fil_rev_8_21_14_0_10_40_38 TaxID=1974583 RepID=A0A2H0USL3_9BACT|nr:MAG: undecaprenyl-diphosphatase UppP [Candidatus Harrisonbacteria bacterium CG10_big_fil_rev_8_21_14_0_10_40_38]
MNIFYTIVLAIIEGFTEFLPISSTGHLILASKLLTIPSSEFLSSFEIAIQLGAILAVVVLFPKYLFQDKKTIVRIALAFLPTAIIGFILYPFVKGFLLGSAYVVVFALLIGGVVLIFLENILKKKEVGEEIEKLKYPNAVLIGVIQSLAIVPGVSRSAATIIGARFLGLSREAAVLFSFLLAVPTMAAATGFDLLKSGFDFSFNEFLMLGVGFVVSFVFALISVRFLLKFVRIHDFKAFGVYRILVAILFLIFVL